MNVRTKTGAWNALMSVKTDRALLPVHHHGSQIGIAYWSMGSRVPNAMPKIT